MEQAIFQKERRTSNSLKGSALQLTVVISLIITILLSALIYLYAFYKAQDNKMSNKTDVLYLLEAGVQLGKSTNLTVGDTTLSNYLHQEDELVLSKKNWGLYDVISIHAKKNQDSLQKAFLIGLESHDSTVLYLMDEDRNLSVSGKTIIRGDAYLPKSGIKPAFVDGKFYDGKEKIVEGKKLESSNKLPTVDAQRIDAILAMLENKAHLKNTWKGDSHVSFLAPTQYHYRAEPIQVTADTLSGNIIIVSDSLITITANTYIENTICIAPVIRVEKGFVGKVQLFAIDSIIIGDNCHFQYPSSVVMSAKENTDRKQIRIGNNCQIEGTVLFYEPKQSDVPHIIEFGKNNKIYGDIVAYGLLKYSKPFTIHGSVACYRFVTQTTQSMYENYLIDIKFDRLHRSPYFVKGYLQSNNAHQSKNKIVCWLN